jgi:hypothetical protein
MGNRSDVQCRYHYLQLAKDMPQLLQMASQVAFPGLEFARPIPVKPVFQGMPHQRFSMPNRLPMAPESLGDCQRPIPLPPAPAPVQRRRASHFVVGLPRQEERVPVPRVEFHSDEETRHPIEAEPGIPEAASIAQLLNSH